MKESILVAIDGSEHSLEALKEAASIAEAFHCKIILLNVQPSFHMIHTRLFINEELIKEYQEELFDNATKAAIQLMDEHKMDYELLKGIGDPTQQICKLAKELDVKYIVMGSRGMGIVRGTALGSVSNGILHEAQVPILIIPAKK
ncbi:MAG: universal stress protein [Bacillus sp. (in: Bacteria)]|nr:universal stress protein [Bacillus sp. (in: firmicutes)]